MSFASHLDATELCYEGALRTNKLLLPSVALTLDTKLLVAISAKLQ